MYPQIQENIIPVNFKRTTTNEPAIYHDLLSAYQKGYGLYHHMQLSGPAGPRMEYQGKPVDVWCLNNYLGLMDLKEAKEKAAEIVLKYGESYPHGGPWTVGSTPDHREFEEFLCKFSNKPAAMLLNLGYQSIMSIVQALTTRKDVLIADKLVHASIMDGIRLSDAAFLRFAHNDINMLEQRLQKASTLLKKNGKVWLIVDGVYSMRGDQAKLKEIVELKKRYNFKIIVDDSHGFGYMGENGHGTPEEQGVENDIDVYFSTFTKTLGTKGAFVASSKSIIEYLDATMRSRIFSTSISLAQVVGARIRLETLMAEPNRRTTLRRNYLGLQTNLRENGFALSDTQSPITPITTVGDHDTLLEIYLKLRETYKVFTYVVAHPVIPKGHVVLRNIVTALHSEAQIDRLLEAYTELGKRYPANFFL